MNKVIVITGASSGIGEATAKLLAKSGNKVVLAARREDKLKQVVNDIRQDNGIAEYLVTDVSKNDDMVNLAKFANEAFGKIDVWINNAGVMLNQPFDLGTIDEFDKMIDINLKGTIYGVKAALPYFEKQKSGQYVNIASEFGHRTVVGSAVYSSTKAAILMFSNGLAKDLESKNIKVSIISPGAVHTDLLTSTDARKIYSKDFVDKVSTFSIDANSIALAIKQTIDFPNDVNIPELRIRSIKEN